MRTPQRDFTEEAFNRLPHTDFSKFPEIRKVCAILTLFHSFKSAEEQEELLKTGVETSGGSKSPFHLELIRVGIRYPETVFGFFDRGQFNPGIIPLFMSPQQYYVDKLEEVLCLENLEGKTVDQVVAMAWESGMTDSGLNSARVRQRINYWDKGKGESLFESILAMSGNDTVKMRRELLFWFDGKSMSQIELNEIVAKYVSSV